MASMDIATENQIEINFKTVHKNPIDKEVQQIFKPLNIMQILVLNPKFSIKNGVISPNNNLNKFILIAGAVIYITIHIHRIVEILIDDNFRRYSKVDFLLFASIFDFAFRCLGIIINCYTNFKQTYKATLLILYYQEVHRFISDTTSDKRFIFRTWLSVLCIFGFYFTICAYFYFFYLKPPWNVLVYLLIGVTLDSNVIYVLRLIKLLTDTIVLWNIQMLLLLKKECSVIHHDRLFHAYVHALECYRIAINIFQPSVSCPFFCR